MLFGLCLTTSAAWAAQECVAGSIDQAGKCLGQPAAVRKVINRELRGSAAPPLLAPFDTRLLATQIAGNFAQGEVARIAGGPRSDWMFLIRSSAPDREGRLVSSNDETPYRLAWIRYSAAPAPRKGQTAADDPRPLIELKAMAEIVDLLPADLPPGDTAGEPQTTPDCVNPEGDENMSGPYTALNGDFRWLQLSPRQRVLIAGVSRSEGYAGGGGSFTGEVMLNVRDGVLVPIACYAIARYQMFGGDWNPDGSRQHPESFAAWKLVVRPGKQWPNLRLQPTSLHTRAASLSWDPVRRQYVEAKEKRH